MIDHKRLLERLNYDKETGIFTWRARIVKTQYDKTWNKKHAGNVTGYTRHNSHKVINLEGREYPCSRLAWLYCHKDWSTKEIDHINGNQSDNRIVNLREATRSENAMNRNTQSNNTTGYKGVWKRRHMNRWEARIMKNGKKIGLGGFSSPELAHEAYVKAAKELHGEFAKI